MQLTEQMILDGIDNINKAGYDQATRQQIERWLDDDEIAVLGDILAKLLEQGKIYYAKGAYYVR